MNIFKHQQIRAHLSRRTGKHLHVLHVLRTYPTCSYPGYQDTTTYAALPFKCQKRLVMQNFSMYFILIYISLEGNELNGSVYHTFWLITEGMTFITSGKSLVLSFTM